MLAGQSSLARLVVKTDDAGGVSVSESVLDMVMLVPPVVVSDVGTNGVVVIAPPDEMLPPIVGSPPIAVHRGREQYPSQTSS